MDLDGLVALLRRHGRTLAEDQGDRIVADPPSLTRDWDRGVSQVTSFVSEDALCRYLLARDLLREPVAVDAPLPAPEVVPEAWCATERWNDGAPVEARLEAVEPVPADAPAAAGPAVAWSRVVGPLTGPVTRGGGLLLLRDAGGLLAHGFDGVAQVTAVDVATGERRWSVPLAPPTPRPVVEAVGAVVLLGLGPDLVGLDTATGAERFRRPAPVPAQRVRRGRPGAPPPALEPWMLLASDGAVAMLASSQAGPGGVLAGVDLADGSTRWTREVAVLPSGPMPLQARSEDGVLRVDRMALADGALVPVLELPAPRGFEAPAAARRGLLRRAEPAETLTLRAEAVAAEAVDGPGVVRVRAERVREGARLIASVVVAPGVAVPLAAELPHEFGTGGSWRVALIDDGRFTVTADGATSLLDATGAVVWQRLAVIGTMAAGPDATLVIRRDATALVGPDGRDRWEHPGQPRWVRGDEAWIARRLDGDPPRTALSAVDLATGDVRWTNPFGGRPVAVGARSILDWHAGDDHVLALAGGRLTAWRAG